MLHSCYHRIPPKKLYTILPLLNLMRNMSLIFYVTLLQFQYLSRVAPVLRPEGKLCHSCPPHKLREDIHFSTLGAIYPIRVSPFPRPEGKLYHVLSPSQALKSNTLLIPSSARHRNALFRLIEGKIKQVDTARLETTPPRIL